VKRYKKQLLVYILLVILTWVFFYLCSRSDDIQQYFHPTKISAELAPQANSMSVILQWFMFRDSDNGFIPKAIGILILTSPFWLFSGYFFARKLNLPGIYNEKRISKKQIMLIVSTGIVWGVLVPILMFKIDDYDYKSQYNFVLLFFLQLLLAIVFELIFRLFLLSFVSFIVNQVFKKYISIDKILWIASFVSVILMFVLFYSFKYFHTGTIFLSEFNANLTVNMFVNLPLAFLANLLLCRIFISNGVLYSIITRAIIALLSTLTILFFK
jgi:hypothetical protein